MIFSERHCPGFTARGALWCLSLLRPCARDPHPDSLLLFPELVHVFPVPTLASPKAGYIMISLIMGKRKISKEARHGSTVVSNQPDRATQQVKAHAATQSAAFHPTISSFEPSQGPADRDSSRQVLLRSWAAAELAACALLTKRIVTPDGVQ